MPEEVEIRPHDCGRGNHEWSDEQLEDGSYFCENPGCAMFLFPELGAVSSSKESAEIFKMEMEVLNGEWPPDGESIHPHD